MEKDQEKSKETRKEFSLEARTEAVSRFAEAMNRDDIDGFVYGVSYKDGIHSGITGSKGVLTFILTYIFVDLELSMEIFMKGYAVQFLRKLIGKEEKND